MRYKQFKLCYQPQIKEIKQHNKVVIWPSDHNLAQTCDKRVISRNPNKGAIEEIPFINWICDVSS